MKNNGIATAAAASAHFNHTPSNADNIVLEYKNHPAYVLFISSLRANHTKIKYDGCLQKYLKNPCNKNAASLSDILAKDPKVIQGGIIQQLIEMKEKNFSSSTLSVHIQVYASSGIYAYTTFCTPDCGQAIDRYLEYRKRIDNSISFDPHIDQWISSDPNALLITRLFDLEDFPNCSSNFVKRSKNQCL
jgi:hypothetical protein